MKEVKMPFMETLSKRNVNDNKVLQKIISIKGWEERKTFIFKSLYRYFGIPKYQERDDEKVSVRGDKLSLFIAPSSPLYVFLSGNYLYAKNIMDALKVKPEALDAAISAGKLLSNPILSSSRVNRILSKTGLNVQELFKKINSIWGPAFEFDPKEKADGDYAIGLMVETAKLPIELGRQLEKPTKQKLDFLEAVIINNI